MNKTKIVILGAGIGGLSTAHELLKFKNSFRNKNSQKDDYNLDITIIERNNQVGGLARSGGKLGTGKDGRLDLPTEYCWRIYGPFYENLRETLKEIPITNDYKKMYKNTIDISTKNNLHDNLVDLRDYIIARDGQNDRPNKTYTLNNSVGSAFNQDTPYQTIHTGEKIMVIDKFLFGLTSCDERLDSYDNVSWRDFLKNTDGKLSYELENLGVRAVAPFLGLDYNKVNTPVVLRTLENFQFLTNKPISVMNGGTSEAFLDQWAKYLIDNGINILPNSNITKINTNNNKITDIVLQDGSVVNADYFVCGLSVESMASLIEQNFDMKVKPILSKIPELAVKGRQLMLSVQYYLNSLFSFDGKKTAIYLPDSPWQIVIEPQGHIFEVDLSKYGDGNVKDIWSVALDDDVSPGLLYGKPWIECTEQEIKEELWHQILITKSLENLKSDDGYTLQEIKILDFFMWQSFTYDTNSGRMDTWEPKFSNNVGTLKLRPYAYTDYKNLFYATAYCRTASDTYEMETAVLAGRNATQALIDDMIGLGKYEVKRYGSPRTVKLLAPLRGIDALLFNLSLPHLSCFTARSAIILVLLYLFIIVILILYLGKYLYKKL